MPAYKGKKRSNAIRPVIAKRPNEPVPVKENGKGWTRTAFNSTVYYLRPEADPGKGSSYSTVDGQTLNDLLSFSTYSTNVRNEFRDRTFRSSETMCNWLQKHGVSAYPVDDGIVASMGADDETKSRTSRAADAYNAYRSGEVYDVMLVDDPDDDTGSLLYVDDPREVPGTVIKSAKGPVYGKDSAIWNARDLADDVGNPNEWMFSVRQIAPEYKIDVARARQFGYDGRMLAIDESMTVKSPGGGTYIITRQRDYSKPSSIPFTSSNRRPASKVGGKKVSKSTKPKSKSSAQPRKANGQFSKKPKTSKPRSKGARR